MFKLENRLGFEKAQKIGCCVSVNRMFVYFSNS